MKLNPGLNLRRSEDRGHVNHGWLDTHHTFSFGDYYDPAHMAFRSLRVINDDRVAGGGGFPSHPHRDMEIFSYVLEGKLAHQDSMGNQRVLEPGQIQLMSAGKGVSHSEFNPSSEPTHFLQIWILPRERNLEPVYTEWHPSPGSESDPKVLVISPDGRQGSAVIHQEVDVWRVKGGASQSVRHELSEGRGLWLHVAKGRGRIGEMALQAGDAISSEDAGIFEIQPVSDDFEALLFDIG